MYDFQRRVCLAANSLLLGTTDFHVRSEIAHPCTFFIDEFEAKPQTSLLRGTSGIHAAFACEVEQPVKQLYIRVQLLNDKFF